MTHNVHTSHVACPIRGTYSIVYKKVVEIGLPILKKWKYLSVSFCRNSGSSKQKVGQSNWGRRSTWNLKYGRQLKLLVDNYFIVFLKLKL